MSEIEKRRHAALQLKPRKRPPNAYGKNFHIDKSKRLYRHSPAVDEDNLPEFTGEVTGEVEGSNRSVTNVTGGNQDVTESNRSVTGGNHAT